MKILILALLTLPAFASPKAIYGEDNRKDVYASTNSLFQNLSLSTAALINEENLLYRNGKVIINSPSLKEMYKLCPNEPFAHQPVAALCSGTLIAPNIILTAGHCYDLPKQTCRDFKWVFDYKVSSRNQRTIEVGRNNVYECEEVIHSEVDDASGIDFALIKLARKAENRTPINLFNTSIKANDPLVLIGHPRGLPTKIADGGVVLKDLQNTFITNLDAFQMNSGSGVFNAQTGKLEGILASGRADFEFQNGCTVSRRYEMNEGNEAVVKLNKVREYLRK